MGNRMLQYAFGSILAKQKNTELFADDIPNFNITGSSSSHQPNDYISTRSYGNNIVNYEELLNTEKDIVIDSFVQKANYYTSNKSFLKEIFSIKDSQSINNNSLVLHIRETDYIQIGCFPGYDFYKSVMQDAGFTDVIIVTDNSKSETVCKLLSDGCKLNTDGYVDRFQHTSDDRAMNDFFTLLTSAHIAISQSTFSWWAAFLGDHKTIIFPYSTKTKNQWNIDPKNDDTDLYFDFGTSKKLII